MRRRVWSSCIRYSLSWLAGYPAPLFASARLPPAPTKKCVVFEILRPSTANEATPSCFVRCRTESWLAECVGGWFGCTAADRPVEGQMRHLKARLRHTGHLRAQMGRLTFTWGVFETVHSNGGWRGTVSLFSLFLFRALSISSSPALLRLESV